MGLGERSDRMYLRVSLGAVRKTVKEGTPKAKSRETNDGTIVWELIWKDLSGTLGGITFRDHAEYGKQWTLLIDDGDEHFALQVHEDSRYGTDLLRKIPNLKQGMQIKVLPYDFKDENDAIKCGISITDLSTDKKVTSYFQQYQDMGEGKPPAITNLYGYPAFDGDWKDKDETKVYFIKLAKFLRNFALDYIQKGGFKDYEAPTNAPPADGLVEKDDLPF